MSESFEVTVTDTDGDPATAVLNIDVLDDGPTISANDVAAPTAVLDESLGADPDDANAAADDTVGPTLVAGSIPFGQASFAAGAVAGLFTTAFGADGAAAAADDFTYSWATARATL